MPYSIRYDADRRIVRIKLTTKFEVAVVKSAARDAMVIASKHDCKALFMDLGETALLDETEAIYGFVTSLPDLGIKHDVAIACVSSRDDPGHRFLETVAKNRGYDVQCFVDIKAAEDWLARRSPDPEAGGGSGSPLLSTFE